MPSNLEIVRSMGEVIEDPEEFLRIRDELVAARDSLASPPRESPIGRQFALVIHEDVVIDMREIELGWLIGEEVFRGLDGWIRMWAGWFETWDRFDITRRNWEELEGGEVIEEIAVALGGRSSGATVPIHQFHLYSLTAGRVQRLSAHPTLEAALAAVRS